MSKTIMDRLTTKWEDHQAAALVKVAETQEKQMQGFVTWLLDHLKWEPESVEWKDGFLMAEGDGLTVSAEFIKPSRVAGIQVWLSCPSCTEVVPSYDSADDMRTLAEILFTTPFVPDVHNNCPQPAIPPVEGS